jgi:hypothetical protein
MKKRPGPCPRTINASSTFLMRSRCKHCGQIGKLGYYYEFVDFNGTEWNLDNRDAYHNSDLVMYWLDETGRDYYYDMKRFGHTKLRRRKFYPYHTTSMPFKGFNPQDIRIPRASDRYRDNVIVVCANCGGSYWSSKSPLDLECPEFKNRKARFSYPVKIKVLRNR